MGHRTGFFMQSARGRAIVRRRRMNEARMIQRAIEFLREGQASPAERILGWESFHNLRTTDARLDALKFRLASAVRRAREANRDWRSYRQTAVELGEIERVNP